MSQLDLDFLNINEHTFKSDPIAIAIIRSEGDGTVSMRAIDDDPNIHETIKKEGYLERAKRIREYYRKKLFIGSFDGMFMNTRFRRDLQRCLERKDIHVLDTSEIGMIAKIPEYYVADTIKDEVKEICDTEHELTVSLMNHTLDVEYLRSTMARYGTAINHSHWFKTHDNKAVEFMITHDNPLVDIFHDVILKTKYFKLIGNFYNSRSDKFCYYKCKGKIALHE